MNVLSGLILTGCGLWISWINLRALSTGMLPFGRRAMWKTLVLSRSETPVKFWFGFVCYVLVAIWLFACAMRYFSGLQPLFPFKGWA